MLPDPVKAGAEYKSDTKRLWAIKMDSSFFVVCKDGMRQEGAAGDYFVGDETGDRWVINGVLFERFFELVEYRGPERLC